MKCKRNFKKGAYQGYQESWGWRLQLLGPLVDKEMTSETCCRFLGSMWKMSETMMIEICKKNKERRSGRNLKGLKSLCIQCYQTGVSDVRGKGNRSLSCGSRPPWGGREVDPWYHITWWLDYSKQMFKSWAHVYVTCQLFLCTTERHQATTVGRHWGSNYTTQLTSETFRVASITQPLQIHKSLWPTWGGSHDAWWLSLCLGPHQNQWQWVGYQRPVYTPHVNLWIWKFTFFSLPPTIWWKKWTGQSRDWNLPLNLLWEQPIRMDRSHPHGWVVHNIHSHSVTGRSPFYLILRYEPQTHPSLINQSKLPTVEEHFKTLVKAWDKPLAAHEFVQQTMKSCTQPKFNPFQVGDKVWLEAWNLKQNIVDPIFSQMRRTLLHHQSPITSILQTKP